MAFVDDSVFDPFRDAINTELPRRSALLTVALAAYDGDPNDGGAPDILQLAPIGTEYLRETPDRVFYRKANSGPTDWQIVGAGASAGSGWVYCADLNAQSGDPGVDKVYQDTGATVLQTVKSPSPDIRVAIRSSFPLVTVNGTPGELTRDVDQSHYSGTVDITLGASGPVEIICLTPDGNDGAVDTVGVVLDLPPTLQTLSFTGSYPGSQTELKAGDTFQITGTTDFDADAVEVQNYEAGTTQLIGIPTGTSFTVSMTIADRGDVAVARPARVRARSATTGAFGPTRDTNELGGTTDGVDLVTLNDLYPTLTFGTITYPPTQGALKASETATVAITRANLTSIVYSSPNGDVSVTNPTLDEATKTVQRIAGSYNVSTTNFRGVATRAANAAVTTTNGVVRIANVAAQITVTEPATRLRSGGNNGTAAQNHTITINSNQLLNALPSLSADVGGGTFTGAWAGAVPGTSYTRTLQVHDDDVKGTYTWQSLTATNLSGIVTSVITGDATYVLGGAVARTITFAAFSQTANIGVAIVDYSKVQAGVFTATNQPALRNAVQGDTSNISNTYTVTALGVNPTTVFWNDQAAAASNSSGTAQLTAFEEVV
jgi:hypothetical protein